MTQRRSGSLRPDRRSRLATAKLLVEYGGVPAGDDVPFNTPDPVANAFVMDIAGNPFAFLVAVVCNQGWAAERIWSIPWSLRQRLGHFDLGRIAREREAVRRAFTQPSHLHRFGERVAEWVCDAAERVEREYGGLASNLWNDQPPATELVRRLDAFAGVGQKKAAMAVRILHEMGVPIRASSGNDVAVDVHVRRVFLRSALADSDSAAAIIAAARGLNPEQPDALDFAAWDIGRNWCHATDPDCNDCPLNSACPRLIERAQDVHGN